jgi:hypothetical protein
MQTLTANETPTRSGAFADPMQRTPVGVMPHERLLHTLTAAQQAAECAGLTPDRLDALLADES